nr:RNA-directed DNA polymerase, eukaryota [Tanacetum cinerariifolium]
MRLKFPLLTSLLSSSALTYNKRGNKRQAENLLTSDGEACLASDNRYVKMCEMDCDMGSSEMWHLLTLICVTLVGHVSTAKHHSEEDGDSESKDHDIQNYDESEVPSTTTKSDENDKMDEILGLDILFGEKNIECGINYQHEKTSQESKMVPEFEKKSEDGNDKNYTTIIYNTIQYLCPRIQKPEDSEADKGVAMHVHVTSVAVDETDTEELNEAMEEKSMNNEDDAENHTSFDEACEVNQMVAGEDVPVKGQDIKSMDFVDDAVPEIDEPESKSDEEQKHVTYIKTASSSKKDDLTELQDSSINLRGFTRGKKSTQEMDDDSNEFNTRGPNFLPEVPDPDAETVDLKHQTMDKRKNAEEWMVDFALQQAVTTLAPTQKKEFHCLLKLLKRCCQFLNLPIRSREPKLPLAPSCATRRLLSSHTATATNAQEPKLPLVLCPSITLIPPFGLQVHATDQRKRQSGRLNDLKTKLCDIDKALDHGGVNDDILLSRMDYMKQLQDIKSSEARNFIQRAKIQWAIEGDENSKFFHGIINKRRANLSIKGVMVDGEWMDDPNRAIELEAPLSRDEIRKAAIELEAPLSRDEIRKAVWDVVTINPPGLMDSLSNSFVNFGILSVQIYKNQQAMVFKVDFAKAYDSIRWDFLDDVLNCFGFGCKWRSWIRDDAVFVSQWSQDNLKGIMHVLHCFSLLSGLKINLKKSHLLGVGVPTPTIMAAAATICCSIMETPFNYLGIMVGGNMSLIKSWDDTVSKLKSRLSKWKLKTLSDAVFVSQWSQDNLKGIMHVLHCFSLLSGLKINLKKSHLLGVGVPTPTVMAAAATICCSIMETPFNYLGIMVGGNMSLIKSWDDTVSKLKSRLSKWKLKTLSIGGRFTLLKLVLGSTPIYSMSLYKVTKAVIHSMEAIRRNFFNGIQDNERKIAWVKWSKVLASKKQGGLGVSSFYALNRAFLVKWMWRIRVGNGLQTSFWNDPWIGDSLLRDVRNLLDTTFLPTDVTPTRWVKTIPIKINIFAWKVFLDRLPTRSNLNSRNVARGGGAEAHQRDLLLDLIEPVILSNMEDRWTWDLNGDGVFRVKDVRNLLDTTFLPTDVTPTRWVKTIPIKINIFAWKVHVQGEPPAVDQKASEPPAVDNRPPAIVTPSDTKPPVEITHPFPYWTPRKNHAITMDLHKWAAQIIGPKHLETQEGQKPYKQLKERGWKY